MTAEFRVRRRHERLLSGFVVGGFSLSAVGSLLGFTPPWPARVVWAGLAAVAAITVLLHAVRPTLHRLQLSTVAMSVAALARGLGYATTSATVGGRMAAAGAWLVVVALIGLRHRAAREGFL